MAKKNYYKMLGVSRTASPEEISAAKNRLAKKYHPDANMKNGIDTTRKMQQILEAYRILSDPKNSFPPLLHEFSLTSAHLVDNSDK